MVINSDFYLNDLVSQFMITVNLYTSNGKYAYAKKTLTSSKNLYSKFTLPTTLVRGDRVSIPITIHNNLFLSQDLKVIININDIEENMNVNINAQSEKQISYDLNIDERFEGLDNFTMKVSLLN